MSMSASAKLYNDLVKVLITRDEIDAAIQKIGAKISEDYAGRSPFVICILKGAAMFCMDLVRAIDVPLQMDFMAVSSYAHGTTSGAVRLVKDLDKDITGRDLIIVEDIVDTGKTLNYLKRLLESRGAASVKICSLLDKPARRIPEANNLKVDYSCFEVPDEFVVGYGLDYDEKYRNLPDIGVLKPELYQ